MTHQPTQRNRAAEETSKMTEAYPMKTGGGCHSYTKNSIFQRGAIDVDKQIMNEAIVEKLEIGTQLVSSSTFRIADLGCSVGPNTFFQETPNGIPHCQSMANMSMNLIDSSLIDLAQKGIVSEEKVDSFKIPTYNMCPEEFEAAVERNGCFSIERMQVIPPVLVNGTLPNAHQYTFHIRAAAEALIKQQFGDGIIDELF